MYQKLYTFASILVTALLSVIVVTAQLSCDALLEEALLALEENCEATGRNEACYGFDQVEASFLSNIDEATFVQPSDIAPVAELETLRTAPLSLDDGTWGVAVMNLQANLPDTLPGQTVTFVLMGDVEVENAVDPDTAFDPNDGIDVIVSTEAGINIRSGPGLNFNVIGGGAFNDVLVADGLSEDGEWIRVAYRNRPAWVSRGLVFSEETIEDLPTLTPELNTPMQAFYLRTGIGQPRCAEVPDDLLLVQGPENIEIELTVNGADITLGSSGALRVIEIGGELFLEIIVFDGEFGVDGQTIRAGQRSILCLGDGQNLGLDGEANDLTVTCGASEPETIPTDTFGEVWCVMEDVPPDILNYGLDVLCPGETPPPTTNTTVSNTGPISEAEGVDCSTLSIPLQAIPRTNFNFTWIAATGATNYEVVVFDAGGNPITSRTDLTGTAVELNGGTDFADTGEVHVRAFRDGEYACFVSFSFGSRAPDPNEPPGGYGATVEEPVGLIANLVFCELSDGISFTVTYSNASGPVTVVVGGIEYEGSAPSGTISDNSVPENPNSILVLDDDESVSLSTSGCTFPT